MIETLCPQAIITALQESIIQTILNLKTPPEGQRLATFSHKVLEPTTLFMQTIFVGMVLLLLKTERGLGPVYFVVVINPTGKIKAT